MTHHASFCLTFQKTTIMWYKTRSRATTATRSSAHCILSSYTTRTTATKCSALPCVSCLVIWNMILVLSLNCNDRHTCEYIKKALPNVTLVEYFSDGCAGQYKNFKTFLNLCYHSSDFGLRAIWSFFATSHGKSPCDGLGGTVKRLLLRASLQRPVNDLILSFNKVMTFCTTSIKGITFFEISKDDTASVRERQKVRYQLGNTVEGTRSSHHFEPQSCSAIRAKHLSAENRFSINHSLSLPPEEAHEQLIASI